jgi:hypothetical protein
LGAYVKLTLAAFQRAASVETIRSRLVLKMLRVLLVVPVRFLASQLCDEIMGYHEPLKPAAVATLWQEVLIDSMPPSP